MRQSRSPPLDVTSADLAVPKSAPRELNVVGITDEQHDALLLDYSCYGGTCVKLGRNQPLRPKLPQTEPSAEAAKASVGFAPRFKRVMFRKRFKLKVTFVDESMVNKKCGEAEIKE